MSESLLFNSFDFYFFPLFEDLIVVLMIYSFIKLLVLSTVNELIWPTQFFNRKHNIGFNAYRLRTYTEVLLKLKGNNNLLLLFNTILVYFSLRIKKN